MTKTKPKDSTTAPRPFTLVHDWVRKIPLGRVMTYGQISVLLDRRISAAAVGWALSQCPDDVPWQRVVNAKGGCSTNKFAPDLQRKLLESEGVEFGTGGTIDLTRFRWNSSS